MGSARQCARRAVPRGQTETAGSHGSRWGGQASTPGFPPCVARSALECGTSVPLCAAGLQSGGRGGCGGRLQAAVYSSIHPRRCSSPASFRAVSSGTLFGRFYRSFGVRSVRRAMRESIFGPISSRSWKAKTKSGHPFLASTRCEVPDWRFSVQPARRRAPSTMRALLEGHWLMQEPRTVQRSREWRLRGPAGLL